MLPRVKVEVALGDGDVVGDSEDRPLGRPGHLRPAVGSYYLHQWHCCNWRSWSRRGGISSSLLPVLELVVLECLCSVVGWP